MKRIAVLTLLMALTTGSGMYVESSYARGPQSDGPTEKSTQKKQNALYKYQKKQEKAQQKAQRRADKQQRKAAKKYEKQQRKQLKNSNRPAKHTRQ
jgi:hypothetical protein